MGKLLSLRAFLSVYSRGVLCILSRDDISTIFLCRAVENISLVCTLRDMKTRRSRPILSVYVVLLAIEVNDVSWVC